MKIKYCILLIISIFLLFDATGQSTPEDLVFKIKVSTDVANNEISLSWNTLPNTTTYRVMRKKPNDASFVQISPNQYVNTYFTDSTITIGEAYEYAVYAGHTNYLSGYVLAGINIAEKHHSGNIMLVIDSTYMIDASVEIDIFKKDLIKEGWRVYTEYAGRNESAAVIKQRILSCNTAVSLEGVVLLGHVPVPYSGNISPDAHSDHIGAWPSDIYYGDMCSAQNSIWNDAVLVNTTASSTRNHNIIGDGKFDVSSMGYTTTTKIFVGRVDVSNMALINSDDVALFKQYLQKNHAYRASIKKFRYQGLVDDNFGYVNGEAFAQNGWRNLSSLLGPDSVHAGKFMTDTKNESYLWSYACGPGWYQGATGIGYITDFRSSELQSVFTMIYGSYFGDWDNSNNFLRGPIASPSSTLVSVWAGRPNWFLHTMALGAPIGYGMLNSIDNTGTYFPKGFANAQVHQSIQGDPTLRMYMFEAPTNLEAFSVANNSKIKLEWSASTAPNVLGYYVYRANDVDGNFQQLNQTPITSLTYIDNSPVTTSNNDVAYMVRAVKNEESVTGNFNNLSPGALTEGISSNAPLPVQVVSFDGVHSGGLNTLSWEVNDQIDIESYEIERSADMVRFTFLGTVDAKNATETATYNYDDIDPLDKSYYRLKIIDKNNEVVYHDKIVQISKSSFNESTEILFPNPAKFDLHLSLETDYNGQGIDIVIFDMVGRVLQSSFVETALRGNNTIDIDIASLSKGSYILHFKKEDEVSSSNIKFTKAE